MPKALAVRARIATLEQAIARGFIEYPDVDVIEFPADYIFEIFGERIWLLHGFATERGLEFEIATKKVRFWRASDE